MDSSYQYHEPKTVFASTPYDTPNRTPAGSQSSRSHRSHSDSIEMSSSPPELPYGTIPEKIHDRTQSPTNDMSQVDLRRFTPNLQASLVAEILSLRRDLEGKTSDIDRLEAGLHETRCEKERVEENAASSVKEARLLKKQLLNLEGGTNTSMVDLSNERDTAVNEASDLRRRLDQFQKRTRLQEQSAERTQGLWERDRQTWDTDKRALETKVHIVESRLKVVLQELANAHTHHGSGTHGSPRKAHLRNGSAASLRSLGAAGRRRGSEASDEDLFGPRISTTAFLTGLPASLADELALNEVEEDAGPSSAQPQTIAEVDEDKEPEARTTDWKERSTLDLSADDHVAGIPQDDPVRGIVREFLIDEHIIKSGASQTPTRRSYIDVAVQYSAPASPEKTVRQKPEPNRVSAVSDSVYSAVGDDTKRDSLMISSASQTTGELPTPPRTPITLQGPPLPVPESKPVRNAMTSSSTQTEEENVPVIHHVSKFTVPVIAIHPPASRPTSPMGDVVLPPHTKNVSCQTEKEALPVYTTSAVQTDDVRFSLQPPLPCPRLDPHRVSARTRFPVKIAPSHLRTKSTSPRPNSSKRRSQQSTSTKSVASKRRSSKARVEPRRGSKEEVPQTPDIESMTQYFEASPPPTALVREKAPETDAPVTFEADDLYQRPTAKFTLRAGKMVSQGEAEPNYDDIFAKIDADAEEKERAMSPVDEAGPSEARDTFESDDGPSSRPKPRAARNSSSRPVDIRKAALISSGTAAHQSARSSWSGQSKSDRPSNPPPFPVPDRHSSRQPPLPFNYGAGASSPTPRSRSPRKKDGRVRKMPLRKTRSAANIGGRGLSQRRPASPSSFGSFNDNSVFSGMSLPPLPPAPLFTPPNTDYASGMPNDPLLHETRSRTGSASSVVEQTSVIDAIAQTMVGEWMFKYVRRRKSFGMPEAKIQDWDLSKSGEELSATITNTGIRHKRWVWLAPYEKSVMWSTKQPTSGPALMGKSGRKLEIQSVLDVRDDNPLPKGSGPGPHFNRSILILTPERALKFTALTQERHYVWLSALSFLSHSPLGLGDLHSLTPHNMPSPPSTSSLVSSLRRHPIRDSIRVAKGRDPLNHNYNPPRSVSDFVPYPSYGDPRLSHYPADLEAADPPTIPRYHSHSVTHPHPYSHTRKRSNTAPRLPPTPLAFLSRNHSPYPPAPVPPPRAPSSSYSHSFTTAPSLSDAYTASVYGNPIPGGGSIRSHAGTGPTATSNRSRRGSEASASIAERDRDDGAPTRRMAAFIAEESARRGGSNDHPGSGRSSYRARGGRKKDLTYWAAAYPSGKGEEGAMAEEENAELDDVLEMGRGMAWEGGRTRELQIGARAEPGFERFGDYHFRGF